jgi:hypothetical protein
MDLKTQIWNLLKEYLNSSEKRKQSKREILEFLFELSFMECGKDYPLSSLTETQKSVFIDLKNMGLIYCRKEKTRRFFFNNLKDFIQHNMELDYYLILLKIMKMVILLLKQMLKFMLILMILLKLLY